MILKKYFWRFLAVFYSIIAICSYGYVKDLFFWREDYQIPYIAFANVPYYFWPYQSFHIVYYPFSFLFRNNPTGYFLSGLVLFILLALTIAFFVLKLTENKLISFLAGLIFVSGYFGSEAMFMVTVGIINYLYLILLLLLLIAYRRFVLDQKLRIFLIPYGIFLVLITIISNRASTAFVIIFLFDLYISVKKYRFSEIASSIRRIIPFFLSTLVIYFIFPYIFGDQTKSASILTLNMIRNFFNINGLIDIGNIIIPSQVQDLLVTKFSILSSQHLASIIGLIFILGIFSVLKFSKLILEDKKFICFLFGSALVSLLTFHLFEYSYIHQSWHRYVILSYPFISMLIAFIIVKLFLNHKSSFGKILGLVIVVMILSINILLSRYSDFTKLNIERSIQAKAFFTYLKNQHFNPSDKTLIYFDVADDSKTQSDINSILAGGAFTSETTVASMLSFKKENLKIAYNYGIFTSEKSGGKYNEIFTFFYNKNGKLINTSDLIKSRETEQKVIDLSKTCQYFYFSSHQLLYYGHQT